MRELNVTHYWIGCWIASLGWGLIDNQAETIEDAGVRTFPIAENPKTGSSLAEPRRLARSSRKRLSRRRLRLNRVKQLFVSQNLISDKNIISTFETAEDKKSPWILRYEGLDRLLSPEELARSLYHIASRRGFKSNRKSELKDKDVGKLLLGISENTEIMKTHNYRTIGEMFYKDNKFSAKKRNQTSSYNHTVSRAELVNEVEYLFNAQRQHGFTLTSEFESQFIQDMCHQRSFDDGDLIDKMRGYCTFEPKEKRAPKYSYSGERFVLVSKVNNLTIRAEGKNKRPLAAEQIKQLIELPYTLSSVKYSQIRARLNIPEKYTFTGLDYHNDNDPEKTVFIELKGFHQLRKIIAKECGDVTWGNLTTNITKLDLLAEVLTCWKSDDNRIESLKQHRFEDDLIEACLAVGSFAGFLSLSNKAINSLLPLMESGRRYDQACTEIYGSHQRIANSDKQRLLPAIPYDDIRNPVVYRALTQTRKVLNAIIRKHGSPEKIHIELGRDTANSHADRKKIEKAQGEFRSKKLAAINQFNEVFPDMAEPKGHDIIKFRLYKEQNGRCPYSGQSMDVTKLLDTGYVDIDHILPWSRSFDDSLNNKVLCLAKENRQKGNKTPFEYIARQDAESPQWQRFMVEASGYRQAKKWRLLKQVFDDDSAKEFKERNINDTRFIAKYLKNFIADNLYFNGEEKQPVQASNGVLTNYLRVKWGLLKNRSDGDLHHAVDALLVAGVTQSMVKQLSEASRRNELWASDEPRKAVEELIDRSTGEIVATNYQKNKRIRLPQPWEGYSNQVIAYVNNEIFVSRMPNRKLKGRAHEETTRSAKYLDKSYSTVKTKLAALTLKNIEDLHDKKRNNRLYNALKERLEEHNGKGDKAFEQPFYMPVSAKRKNTVSLPVEVNSVKLTSTQKGGVRANKGIANQSSMVRTDVFCKEGKFYLVPLYVADFVKKTLPNKAIVASKGYDEWIKMDSSYLFQFSLHRNDLIEIKHKKKGLLRGYYAGCHSGSAAITISPHNRAKPHKGGHWISDKKVETMIKSNKTDIEGIGIKTGLESFTLFEVSVLGDICNVALPMKRHGLA